MNGVLHSEHVISRSGIRGFLHESEMRVPLSCSSERWRCVSFHHKFVGRKRWFLKRYAEKLASRRVYWLECTPAIQIFLRNSTGEGVAEGLHTPASLWRARHTQLALTYDFIRHIGCSLVCET